MNKRQIIFIMTDTTRWDMLGCYGNSDMKTPNLDTLANEGVRFNRAYCCQPVCGPARSAIFTGQFPHSNGSFTNSVPLWDNVKTLGQRLRDNGIHSAYIGKWHLDGGDYFGLGRCPDGWDSDYWYDMRCYLEELSSQERLKSRLTETMKEEAIKEEFTFAHRCSDRAIDFLENNCGGDFFLSVSYDEPHGPFLCPEPYSSMYDGYIFDVPNRFDDSPDKPEHHRVWAGPGWAQEKKANYKPTGGKNYYLGCNSYVDYEIGRVLNIAKELAPDALIVFTSDHGEAMGAHGLSGKGPCAFDEVTRIPFIIKGGAVGEVYDFPVSHIDIAPTVLDYMGLPLPKLFEGKSLLCAINDTSVKINEDVFVEFTRYEIDHDGFGGFQPMRTVFDGRYKLTVNLLSSDELYDLRNDPTEVKNLINDTDLIFVRNRLHDTLLGWMNETRDPFRGYYWERRPWRTDAKQASWSHTGYTRQRENEEYEPRQLDYDTGLEMTEATRIK